MGGQEDLWSGLDDRLLEVWWDVVALLGLNEEALRTPDSPENPLPMHQLQYASDDLQDRTGAPPSPEWLYQKAQKAAILHASTLNGPHAVVNTRLHRTRGRARFCTPSILHPVAHQTRPFTAETSLSDREFGAAPAGDGVFAKVEETLRGAFGGDAYPFTNGSTGAIQAVAEWIATWWDTPLVAVNRIAHKAVVHALDAYGVPWFYLDAADVDERYDAVNPISPKDVRAGLDVAEPVTHVWVNAVTYEGRFADVQGVADAVGKGSDAPLLIVDQAWGAHLFFHGQLQTAMPTVANAHVVTTSMHKQGGSRQGTAILVVGTRLSVRDHDRLRATIRGMGTTSPNLPLLGSIEAAVQLLADPGALADVQQRAKLLRTNLQALVGVVKQVPNADDPLKVLCTLTRGTGYEAADHLAKNGVVVERAGVHSLLFLVPFQVDDLDVDRAVLALAHFAPGAGGQQAGGAGMTGVFLSTWRRDPRQLSRANSVPVQVDDAAGRVAVDIVAAYPPGIPVITPGDTITPAQIAYLCEVQRLGGDVVSGAGKDPAPGAGKVRVYCVAAGGQT